MLPLGEETRLEIDPGAGLLRGYAAPTARLVEQIARISGIAAFRHLKSPGGGTMSVAMTNCGPLGWHSDHRGYRYVDRDPLTGLQWPPMPQVFRDLARSAASAGGFERFEPDACLINRYEPGAQMGAHRDFDELEMSHPIVSVSIGLPAQFLWYGAKRAGSPRRLWLEDGDVVVWGGPSRAAYHGVRKLDAGSHPLTGALRYNLTFRRAAGSG